MSAFYARGEDKSQRCVFCKEGHQANECTNVKEPKERKDKLRQSGRCFICLSQKPEAKNCDRRQRCRDCGYFLHVLIRGADKNTNSNKNGEEMAVKTSVSATVQEIKQTSGTVLLQMVKTYAYNDPENKVLVKILFDLGSQCSYLTDMF